MNINLSIEINGDSYPYQTKFLFVNVKEQLIEFKTDKEKFTMDIDEWNKLSSLINSYQNEIRKQQTTGGSW